MGPKKGRRVRKIKDPTVPKFELGDTAADIQRWREKRVARVMEEAEQQRDEEEARREEARVEETHWQEEVVAEKSPGQRKVTLKQRLKERRELQSHDTRRGTRPTSI